jgi:ABC-type phosphate transport system substrate-binding protein
MTSLFARRMAVCIASAASAVAVIPATASAVTKPDLGQQCSGANIIGRGSTFQNPAQIVWNPTFNTSLNSKACNGVEIAGKKTTAKPTVLYKNTESKDKGSGACLKAFGAEKHAVEPEYSFCGTDEAPNATQKKEIEEHFQPGYESEGLETIPVLQGAVAIIVHLPEGCKASSEVTEKGVLHKLGRLVFDDTTLEGIYAGTINNWKQVVEAQGSGHGNDALTCTGGTLEEETPISRVVRTDHSGTTHIFKSFLEQVETKPLPMEKYEEAYGTGGAKSSTGCGEGVTFPPETRTWESVSEGCQNQRWPEAAHVIRNETETGNGGVINLVNTTASSIGYADLAFVREKKFFSSLGMGGENKKGSATKVGEQNTHFWAEIQNSKAGETLTYADPASKGDTTAVALSNCKNTKYIENEGHEFPPASTRALWNQAKAALKDEHYAICGLTYDLAFRQYAAFLEPFSVSETEGKARATTAENYLLFEVNSGAGGKEIKNHDYEALPKEVLKLAEKGVEEIGYKIA